MRRQEAVILTTQDLEKIADLTLEHYNRRAEDFWEGGQWLRRSISSIRCQRGVVAGQFVT